MTLIRLLYYFSQQCSVDCGKGDQTREVSCQYIAEEKVVNDSLCLQTKKLTAIRQCEGPYCVGEWKVEEWGRVRISLPILILLSFHY